MGRAAGGVGIAFVTASLIMLLLLKLALDIWSAANKTVDAVYCGVMLLLVIFMMITADSTSVRISCGLGVIAILVYARFRFREEKDTAASPQDENQSNKRAE